MAKPSMTDVYAAIDKAMAKSGVERATLMDKALVLFREARAAQGGASASADGAAQAAPEQEKGGPDVSGPPLS